VKRNAVAAAILFAVVSHSAPASADSGSFLHISDIHFNPFDPSLRAKALTISAVSDWRAIFAADPDQSFSKYGEDTNHALFDSSLLAVGEAGVDTDFAVMTGDVLVHRFQDNAESVLGFVPGSAANDAFAVRTTLYVLGRLRAALPGKPIFVSLGNNDSSCGDYRIDPGGSYLAATREIVRELAGPELVADDFDRTWLAGGYYAARHPTVPGATIVVLDDVMWSDEYQNACGDGGLDAANAMMTWLEQKLAGARAAGGKVWLMHHIPVGMDAYATKHSKATECPAKIVPLLKEPFGSTYVRLLTEYGDVVQSSFTGHLHFDDYRLLRDAAGKVTGTEKVAPAISPIFGQNPGFHTFTYDRATGALADFATTYLANLEQAANPAAGDWKEEYTFAAAYGRKDFSPATAEAVWKAFSEEGTADDLFRSLYNVSHGELTAEGIEAWICAIGYADVAGYTKCYCGG
jgi:hypothetical protein